MRSEAAVILIVEDDLSIQSMIEEVLSAGGYQTVLVSTGEEALALIEHRLGTFRVLVTDVNLSDAIDGWAVAKRVRELNPKMPVIYMTGAAADQWTSRGVPGSILLNKPFQLVQFATAVAQLANGGSSVFQE